jgi:hypothetical protein
MTNGGHVQKVVPKQIDPITGDPVDTSGDVTLKVESVLFNKPVILHKTFVDDSNVDLALQPRLYSSNTTQNSATVDYEVLVSPKYQLEKVQ